MIALSEVSPLARPGVLKQVPGWLLDPVGPLAVRFRDLPALTPWLLRFVASATPAKVETATERLAWLMKSALADHQELARRSGLSGHIRRTGSLYLMGSQAAYRAGKVEWSERQRQGVEVEELSPEQTRAKIPALTGPFTGAFFAPENWMVTSPLAILEALRNRLRSSESVAAQEVTAIHPEEREVAVMTDGGRRPSVRPRGGRRRRLVARRWCAASASRCRSRPSAATTRRSRRRPSTCRCRSSSPITASSPRRSPTGSGSAARSRWRRPRPRPTSRAPRRCGR